MTINVVSVQSKVVSSRYYTVDSILRGEPYLLIPYEEFLSLQPMFPPTVNVTF